MEYIKVLIIIVGVAISYVVLSKIVDKMILTDKKFNDFLEGRVKEPESALNKKNVEREPEKRCGE
jgi:hypothetical protein